MFGVKEIDRTGTHIGTDFFNASHTGKAVFDTEFDLSPPENQQSVYNLCQTLRKRDDLLYMQNKTTCWLEDFKSFLEANGQQFPIDSPQD